MSEQIEKSKFDKKTYRKKYYLLMKEKELLRSRHWYEKNREYAKLKSKEWKTRNFEKTFLYGRNRRIKALKIISPLLQCVRCGCNNPSFLEINHKFGGGSKERKVNPYACSTHQIVNGQRQTHDLELLCRPCNHIHFLEKKFGLENTGLKVVWEKPNNS